MPILTEASVNHIISVLSEKGLDYWWVGPVEEFTSPDLAKKGISYVKGTDTMDVWFDSGTSWASLQKALIEQNQGHRVPIADVYLEGSDQHRGWFQSSLLTSIAITGDAPFSTIITHGFVLDEKGHKMSKSIGNVISPLTIINGGNDKAKEPGYGADTLRFWAASAGYTKEVHISQNIIANSAESLRKIRNTLRYLLGNLAWTGDDQVTDGGKLLHLSFVSHIRDGDAGRSTMVCV